MYPRSAPSLRLVGAAAPASLPKALVELGANSLPGARVAAEQELANSLPCGCCLTARIHLTQYFGSTLFLDDDPRQLQLAVPVAARRRWTTRLIAACIVLYGRERVALAQRS
jgi:hypothetical protein